MRISDWSSDVCSSYLVAGGAAGRDCGCWNLIRVAQDGSWPGSVHVAAVTSVRRHRLDQPAAQDPLQRGVHAGRHAAQAAADVDRGALRHPLAHLRRSEEHTSELQSLMRISYAVFCLKKKKHTE